MKQCKKCGEEKPLDAFYDKDNSCKECRKKAVRENYRRNREYYRKYERERAMLPHRVEMRERYLKTEAGKEAIYRGIKKYRENNHIKQQAHNRVNYALVAGKLKKKECCEECGAGSFSLHAHHDDYLRQLDVRWLCPACHRSWHIKNGEAANSDHPPLPRGQFAA